MKKITQDESLREIIKLCSERRVLQIKQNL